MSGEDARKTLNAMSEALVAQRKATTDPALRQELLAQINAIEDQLDALAVLNAQQTAQAINAASSRLEALLATARVNPFDPLIQKAFKGAAERVVQRADAASEAFASHELPAVDDDTPPTEPDFTLPAAPAVAAAPAPPAQPSQAVATAPAPAAPLPTAPAAPAPAAGEEPPPDALPPIVHGNKLAQLAEDYMLCWAACRIRPDRMDKVIEATDRMLKGRSRYEAVSARSKVPWQLIGIMHGLECGYSFFRHLHNGDSLAGPTTHVPEGRPPGWNGTGSWEDSAVDAVRFKFKGITDWSLPQVLYALESFNGFGYRPKGIRSPYLWSFSNLYTKGRYVADHVYDPEAESKQVGSALVLKMLEQRGLWP
jgi:lysozyme family protein